jgi:hypothetical protein
VAILSALMPEILKFAIDRFGACLAYDFGEAGAADQPRKGDGTRECASMVNA